MHLKRLEISGFKSFAHKICLDFDCGITAVVGPNGCGKSNIVDAIRWVMGEQSMKSVRGKKSEDLIFSGSKNKIRLGKASVALFLDNSNGMVPIDFPEVAISRYIFRSGENDYFINNSRVRLKDVVEILAKARMNQKSFSIINQGMADAILNYSPLEREFILEEAAGVREYQIKKEEVKRKIKNSKANLEKVASLITEIAPHLRYLKKQASKAEKRDEVIAKLRDIQKKYFGAIARGFYKEKRLIGARIKSLRDDIFNKSNSLIKIKKELDGEEKGLFSENGIRADLQKKWNDLRLQIGDFEKKLAKVEAKIEMVYNYQAPRVLSVDIDYIKTKITQAIKVFKEALGILDSQEKGGLMEQGLKLLDGLYNEIEAGKAKKYSKNFQENPEFLKEKKGLENKINVLTGEADEVQAQLAAIHSQESIGKQKFFEKERKTRNIEDEISRQKDALRIVEIEGVKIEMQIKDIEKEVGESGISIDEIIAADGARQDGRAPSAALPFNKEEMEKEIRRLRVQLDEIGSIDPATIREFQETNQRYEFLEKESRDIEKSIAGLKVVIDGLEDKIQKTFNDYFSIINDEFNNYFRLIFSGGRASLLRKSVARSAKNEGLSDSEKEDGEDNADMDIQEGVDINAMLPGKKIKDLSLFSGGERSLTSVALLFAIIASSNPPFLVLDEIDAALDEDNSQKFGRILRELSQRTQFILITHNRETMKLANTLYGVTMNDGVSRILSLKLT